MDLLIVGKCQVFKNVDETYALNLSFNLGLIFLPKFFLLCQFDFISSKIHNQLILKGL